MAEDPQSYTMEISVSFHGTFKQAEEEAYHILRLIPHHAEFTGMFDEDWNEV